MPNDHDDRTEGEGDDGGASRFGWLRRVFTRDATSVAAKAGTTDDRGEDDTGRDEAADGNGHESESEGEGDIKRDTDTGTDAATDTSERGDARDTAATVALSDGGNLNPDLGGDRDHGHDADDERSRDATAGRDPEPEPEPEPEPDADTRGETGADGDPDPVETESDATTAWDGLASDGQGGVDVAAKVAALTELLGGTGNVLLTGPADRPIEHELCAALTEDTGGTGGESTADTDTPRAALNLVLVTTDPAPDRRVDVCRSHLGAAPDRLAVINPQTRSSDGTVTMAGVDPEATTVTRLSNPGDLRRLGIVISRQLSAWDDVGGRTVVCVRSLSALFRRVDEELLFRFLYILRDRIDAAGATAHYHLDPAEHDAQVLDRFDPVFDATVRYGEDRSVTID